MVRKKRFYSLISVFKGLKIITEQPTWPVDLHIFVTVLYTAVKYNTFIALT
jgi:hypothetical protein